MADHRLLAEYLEAIRLLTAAVHDDRRTKLDLVRLSDRVLDLQQVGRAGQGCCWVARLAQGWPGEPALSCQCWPQCMLEWGSLLSSERRWRELCVPQPVRQLPPHPAARLRPRPRRAAPGGRAGEAGAVGA